MRERESTPSVEENSLIGDITKELEAAIGDFEKMFEKASAAGPLKSSPLLRLYRTGRLTPDFILSEARRIAVKESGLPSAEREAVVRFMKEAERRLAVRRLNEMMKEEEKDGGTEHQ